MATRHALTPAMRRAIAANRKRILAREAAIAAELAALWHQAQDSITPTQDALISSYSAQLDALSSSDTGDTEGPTFTTSTPTVPMTWAKQSGHLSQLERAVLLAVGGFAVASALHITEGQRIAVQEGAQDAQALIRTALHPLVARIGLVTADALIHGASMNVLHAFIGKSQTTGNPLSDLLATLDKATAHKVTKVLYAALASGSHPTVAARMLNQATSMARNRALVVARTEMLSAYRSAALETFRANSNVIEGWTWQAAADACPFCASMDGTHHTLDETLDSHPQCRCAMVPDTKPLDAILAQFAA